MNFGCMQEQIELNGKQNLMELELLSYIVRSIVCPKKESHVKKQELIWQERTFYPCLLVWVFFEFILIYKILGLVFSNYLEIGNVNL